eukprot:2192215-Amphidinium_carterae.1
MSSPTAPLSCPVGQLPFVCGVGPRGHVRGHSVHTIPCKGSEGGCDNSFPPHSVLLSNWHLHLSSLLLVLVLTF